MRYKCVIAYDGHDYMGFQIQEDLKTIELEIMIAFKKLLNKDIKIYPSGRTDRYVHAKGQVIHFDLDSTITPIGIKRGLNSFLPEDIYVLSCEEVNDDFHARFSAKSKEYRYYINFGEYDPLNSRYSVHITNLDLELMRKAIKKLEGIHDFKGFASSQIDKRKSTIKEIYKTEINVINDKYYEFIFIGNGFLKYQIRRMMGLIVEIGRHKEDIDMIDIVFEKKDPSISHRSLDGNGLFLYEVKY